MCDMLISQSDNSIDGVWIFDLDGDTLVVKEMLGGVKIFLREDPNYTARTAWTQTDTATARQIAQAINTVCDAIEGKSE